MVCDSSGQGHQPELPPLSSMLSSLQSRHFLGTLSGSEERPRADYTSLSPPGCCTVNLPRQGLLAPPWAGDLGGLGLYSSEPVETFVTPPQEALACGVQPTSSLQKGRVSSWSWTVDCGWAEPSAPALGFFPQLSCAQGGRGAVALTGKPPLAPCGWRRLVLHPACAGALCLYALLSASERRVLC